MATAAPPTHHPPLRVFFGCVRCRGSPIHPPPPFRSHPVELPAANGGLEAGPCAAPWLKSNPFGSNPAPRGRPRWVPPPRTLGTLAVILAPSREWSLPPIRSQRGRGAEQASHNPVFIEYSARSSWSRPFGKPGGGTCFFFPVGALGAGSDQTHPPPGAGGGATTDPFWFG